MIGVKKSMIFQSGKPFVSLVFGLLLASQSAHAQDIEWPCVQVLVPTVELGVMWPEAVEPEVMTDWKSDKEIASLAGYLADLDEYTEKDSAKVQEFASALVEPDIISQLNLLAAGTVVLANDRRSFYIKGIRKYTRQQNAMANQVEEGLTKLESFGSNTDTAEFKEIEETLKWHQRIFDQREKSIRLLCEQPVVLEQTLSQILRDISQYLP